MKKTLSGVCEKGAMVALLLCFWNQSGSAAEKIRIATGGLAASSAAVWAALETKSFQKHGLEAEYIIIDNGTVSGQALLAGELQYLVSTGALAISANMLALGSLGMLLSDLQIVIVGKLFPRRDIASRLNKNSMTLLLDLAIRRTRMIDPACRVSSARGVDDQAVVDRKQHRVWRMRLDAAIAPVRLLIGDQLTFVFNDARSLWNPP